MISSYECSNLLIWWKVQSLPMSAPISSSDERCNIFLWVLQFLLWWRIDCCLWDPAPLRWWIDVIIKCLMYCFALYLQTPNIWQLLPCMDYVGPISSSVQTPPLRWTGCIILGIISSYEINCCMHTKKNIQILLMKNNKDKACFGSFDYEYSNKI